MSRFKDKVVLVTGGRTGIGRAVAEQFASDGARVFTAQRGIDDRFESIQADFSDVNAAKNVIDHIVSMAGRLDVLINNAGVMSEATVEECDIGQWHHTMTVNLTTPFLLTKYALPYLKHGGAIVNVGSIEGLGSNPGHPAYGASKAGLHGLTRAVAVDHGYEGVRCNAVAPGWIDTELNEAFIDSMENPTQFRASIADIHPLRTTGKPEEIASVVLFLASDDARFITGQVYTVDGGRMSMLSLPT